MLSKENKIVLIVLGILCMLFSLYFLPKRENNKKYDVREIQKIRNDCMSMSMGILGKDTYWKLYNQINDSINAAIDFQSADYFYYRCNPFWMLDSVYCINKEKDKLIAIALKLDKSADSVLDYLQYFYGIKIKGNWYFIQGATIALPREYYQKDIYVTLGYEKMKQIVTDEVFKYYLKKDKKGNEIINPNFFSTLDNNAKANAFIDQSSWEESYLKLVQETWAKRDTTPCR